MDSMISAEERTIDFSLCERSKDIYTTLAVRVESALAASRRLPTYIDAMRTIEERMAEAEQAATMLDAAAQKHDALGEAVYAEVCRAQAEGIRGTLKILQGAS